MDKPLNSDSKNPPINTKINPDTTAGHEAESSVVATNNEALFCRAVLASSMILEDEYVLKLWSKEDNVKHERSVSPLMQRGTFVRTRAIDNAISQFLTSDIRSNVLVLGAGFDTRWFRLFKNDKRVEKWVEVDFESVIARKKSLLGDYYDSSNYKLFGWDLNNLELSRSILKSSEVCWNTDNPLIVVTECCFMYLKFERQLSILSDLGKISKISVKLVLFEPFLGRDSFSTIMCDNFRSKGINIDGTKRTLSEFCDALKILGWSIDHDQPMSGLADKNSLFLDDRDHNTLAKFLFLDEYEEWEVICGHYHLLLASVEI